MLNLTQIIGTIIAVLLAGLFLIIGYQIVLILQETKKSIHKVNRIIDDAQKITKSIAEPVVSVSGFLTGLKDGAKLISLFTDAKSKKKKHEQQ